MDILRIWYERDAGHTIERAKIYHNIDPDSIVIQQGYIYFAHPDAWQSDILANRYRIPTKGACQLMVTDPQEIKKYAEEHTGCINRGFYVSNVA